MKKLSLFGKQYLKLEPRVQGKGEASIFRLRLLLHSPAALQLMISPEVCNFISLSLGQTASSHKKRQESCSPGVVMLEEG